MRLPGKVEVLEGLAAGDLVVTAGQTRLMRGDSQPVKVIDLARAAEGRAPGAARPAASAASGARTPPV